MTNYRVLSEQWLLQYFFADAIKGYLRLKNTLMGMILRVYMDHLIIEEAQVRPAPKAIRSR
ncbi:hypothetical protein PITCH_A1690010 [uncultured Desulfobacterium sp.]|uniref:Uncharacterized protein n=1 Tax=uncultured Desulfobacterium sp. TaxID=201089 RepID=A0A445MUJ8_9BACT|nr:hypothetical protein PITCH_A1690010 [uncultured Desulfobacterium sp.]